LKRAIPGGAQVDYSMVVPAITPLRRPSAASGFAGTALTSAMLGAIGIVTGTIAARWLGPEGRGELAAIQLWPSVMASVAMIGLPEALVYFSAKHPSESRRYLLTAGLIALVLMPLFVVIGYILMPRLLPTQSAHVVQAAQAYLIFVPVYAFVGLPHQLLRGIQKYRLWNIIRVVPPLLWLAMLAVVVYLRITDPIRIAAAFVAMLACVGPAVTWVAWKNSVGAPSPTLSTISSMVRFGFPSALATLPQFFSLKLDQMMVAALVPARDLGMYMVAVAWGACIPMLSSALAIVVSTQIAAGSTDAERSRHFSRGVRGAIWLIAGPVIILSAVTPFGITMVFGHAFQGAVVPAMILVVAAGANALNGVLEELLRGYGRPAATLWAETTAVAVGLPALLILLPRAGLAGAGLASLVGYLAATAVLLVQSRRFAGLDFLDVLDPRAIPWSNMSALAIRALRLRSGPD
jgi:O-antigen/teichoic acid export membrane protein